MCKPRNYEETTYPLLLLKVLLANGYIMWDIVQSCSIRNSDDTSISDYVPNDIPGKKNF
jgi:hypothetical protein